MRKLLFVLLFGILANIFVFSQEKTMYVSVKSTDLKSSTGVFAEKLGVLNLGDTVTMLRTNGNWAEVRTSNRVTGWVNASSLTSKRVTGSGISSSAGEIALAGKGFSPEAEIEYKKTGLDYSAVDRMETITVSGPDLRKFIEDGKLSKGK
jgi:uncharacterized protein YgiM (DUF1202 family)